MPADVSIMPVYGNNTTPSNFSTGPTFQDIMARLNGQIKINPIRDIGGQGNFQSGMDMLKPGGEGISPEYQKVIDQIRSNATYYGNQGAQNAQALAAKRGMTGSSIEQFGTQTALDSTNRAASDQESQIYLANLQRRQALQDASAKALLDRSNNEATIGANIGTNEAGIQSDQNKLGANLTSDEIASQRNMDMFKQQLALQGNLGQQGIDLARDNINASMDMANQQSKYNLAGSIAQGGLPFLLPKLFGATPGTTGTGSAGWLSSLFGGGVPGATGAGPGGIPLASAANGGAGGAGSAGWLSSLFGGGVPGATGAGPGGIPLASAANGGAGAAGGFAGALPFLGAGLAGNRIGASVFGDNHNTNIGSTIGGVAGSAFGPVGTAAGSFVGSAAGALYAKMSPTQRAIFAPFFDPKNTFNQAASGVKKVGSAVSNAVSSVGHSVSKIFPF